MKFSGIHKKYFGAEEGAFSIITKRENYDSQLTFTDAEAKIILGYYGEKKIHRGAVSENPKLAKKGFRYYNEGTLIFLNINFPKTEGAEIRLYLSKKAGFKPPAGNIWFLFKKNGELWIGHKSKHDWEKLGLSEDVARVDEYDSLYQETIHTIDEKRISKLKPRDVFRRDRKLALYRIKESNFKCEVDEAHNLFISRFTGKPYLEAHHLIPLGSNDIFDTSLDVIENIFCLCPFCHRAIHHAEEDFAKNLITTLINKRDVLKKFSLHKEDLFYLYSI